CEPESWAAADDAIARLPAYYDWMVFTSANGVERFGQRVRQAGKDARAFAGAKLCAIGSETAKALERQGLTADLVPDAFVAEAVADALVQHSPRRVLIPRAAVARDVLPARLTAHGAEVDVVEVYRTQAPEGAAERLRELVAGGKVNVVTFTSSSTVTNFLTLAGGLPPNVKVACIGPITRRTAEEQGLKVDIEASTYTTAGLKQALIDHYGASV
ncbi:MAG TPA: uroporphyrinogen-III synthase, partial [Chloroflexota bacterium]|nr:uroporphyrinogen-III synthase [Chloroflexota bacterium]